MKCPQCGEPNPPERPECAKCGAPLPDALDQSAIRAGEQTLPTAQMPPSGPTLKPDPTLRAAQGTPAPTELTGSILRGAGGTSSPSSPSLSGELTLNRVFGNRYEILSLIGQGGMGRVYAARDRELDRVIALKTIKADEEAGPEAIQRFKQELLLARKITHKNVVRIHDLGEAEGIKFFTMEFIEGESLKALIRRRGRVPPAEAITLARQVIGALHEAHSQGIVHRDLKPQNIMVDKKGTPYLMDFGIARSVETTGMTATGAIVGTPDYMSPEQVRGEKAGPQSDIFSIGVILYEMLTGDLPYKADTAASKIMMRLTHKPRPPRELSQDIPRYLESIILKCMEVDVALRYQSASEILNDLDREDVGRALTLRVQRAVARRKGTVAAAAAIAVVALGVYWTMNRRSAPDAGPPEGPVHTLAIVPFTNATGSPEFEWMRTAIPEMLVTDLSQSKYVRPVPGERVFRVLQQAGVAQQSRFDEAALESISKMAHAQSVLSGQFVDSAGKLRLDLALRKAGTGVVVPIKLEAASSEVFGIVDAVTRSVKEHLDLTPAQLKGDSDRPVTEVSTASLEALRAYQSGLAQLRQGTNQAAIPLLHEATAKDSGFAMAYAKLAEAHLNTGDHHEAEAAIAKARSLSETAPLALAERYQIHAAAAQVSEDYETAAQSYAELAKLYPDDPDNYMNLAQAQERAGKFEDAAAAYRRVLQLSPGYGAALLGLGRSQQSAGHPDEAIRSLQEALATKQFEGKAESVGMIHSVLGVAYRNTAQFDKAVEHFNLSLELRRKTGNKGGEGVTLYNLATVYGQRGETDKAIDYYGKALAIARAIGDRRRESNAVFEMGRAYKEIGKLDKALNAYRESMRIETEREDHANQGNRLNEIADIYRLMGRYDDAMVYLEQAKAHLEQSKRRVDQSVNFTHIGKIKKAQGLYDEAAEAFLAALAISKEIEEEMGVADIQHHLAEIYKGQGRLSDAYASLRQSLDLYTHLQDKHGVAEVGAVLGHVLVALGRAEEAEKTLAEAERVAQDAKAKGTEPEILLGRAEVAHITGRHEEAGKLFEQANVKANLSGQKEIAVESRIELGHLYLEQGKLDSAERLLLRTRQEAVQARLRPFEAQAAAVLAEVYLARGQGEPARKAATDAIRIAEKFSGRPTLYRAYATLGEALEKLKKPTEAVDAYAKAASTLEWIRGSLLPEHVGSFVARADVQAFLRKTVAVLEKGGRTAEAEPLRKWLGATPSKVAS